MVKISVTFTFELSLKKLISFTLTLAKAITSAIRQRSRLRRSTDRRLIP